jgi:peptide/nickel transport system permease protein
VLTYIAKRISVIFPVLLAISLIVFLIMHFAPGDPAALFLGQMVTSEELEKVRREMGLDDPLHIQYLRFLKEAVKGDLGISYYTKQSVLSELLRVFPATVELAVASMVIALLVGISAGIISALKQNSIFDNVSMVVALGGVSMPVFWVGLILLWIFSLKLGWTPISGRLAVQIDLKQITGLFVIDSIITGNIGALKDSLRHLILPALSLATISMGIIARFTRSSMLEVIRQDYIRTARAKGVSEALVIFKHAFKNALIPVVTVVGLQFGLLLGGAVVTETVFSWPGIGNVIIVSILRRDYPMVQGALLLLALLYVIINLLVDVSYSYLDPRIRYR